MSDASLLTDPHLRSYSIRLPRKLEKGGPPELQKMLGKRGGEDGQGGNPDPKCLGHDDRPQQQERTIAAPENADDSGYPQYWSAMLHGMVDYSQFVRFPLCRGRKRRELQSGCSPWYGGPSFVGDKGDGPYRGAQSGSSPARLVRGAVHRHGVLR